jgi:hypothetical protein
MEFAYCLSLACSNFGKYERRLGARASNAAAQVRDSQISWLRSGRFRLRHHAPKCHRQLRCHLAHVDTSNGCQDHTASPYATTSFVSAAPIAQGLEPALPSHVAPDAAASTGRWRHAGRSGRSRAPRLGPSHGGEIRPAGDEGFVACANMAHLGCPISGAQHRTFPDPHEHIHAGNLQAPVFSRQRQSSEMLSSVDTTPRRLAGSAGRAKCCPPWTRPHDV